MRIRLCFVRFLACLSALLVASAASAQLPTFSLEAVAIGSQPEDSGPTSPRAATLSEFKGVSLNTKRIPGGPVNRVVIAPGDVIAAKIFVRDWSPNGEQLSAYQAQIDPKGYSSGNSGFVKPPHYQPDQPSQVEDLDNCYLNVFDPQFLHLGLSHLPLTDSVSSGYRWASILVRPDQGPTSAQDGKKYYCGSLNLIASDDASGTFAIGFIEDTSSTGLRSQLGVAILPNDFEPLVVVVRPIDWTSNSLAESLVDGLNGMGKPADATDADIDGDENLAPTDLYWLISLANRSPSHS